MSKAEKFLEYLDEQINACEMSEKRLQEEFRLDERVFEKVRSNVYQIFKTVFGVAVKSEREEETKQFFLGKLVEIPTSWQLSYEKAEKHGDMEKMQIENIKLKTITEIKEKFIKIWEQQV